LRKSFGEGDPVARLEIVRSEIDRFFGEGHAAGHPELVIAVKSSDDGQIGRTHSNDRAA
jgi:hypothetical protein